MSVTVQSGPGQIAPPLIMLLFLACRHNWNKAPPPSTLDGWECCLLSKTIVDYLSSRLLYVTFDIIRDNSSQQLLLFQQLLSHSPYNNSTTTLWIKHSLVTGTQPMLDWSFHVYLTRCVQSKYVARKGLWKVFRQYADSSCWQNKIHAFQSSELSSPCWRARDWWQIHL